MDVPDHELLLRYATAGSEAAFAELVNRYLPLVYHAALRRVGGDAHLAEEVAQKVFTLVAARSRALAKHEALVAWLHTTTRNVASEALRAERRRRAREQEAFHMQTPPTDGPDDAAAWEKLRPVIDDALGELDERDRQAVLLRFFSGLPLAQVGARLSLTENAARMRVDRALDKLEARLARRGVTSTGAALGLALTAQGALAAPAGLAATVTSTALAAGSASTAVSALVFMGMTKLQVGAIAALAIAGSMTLVYQGRELIALHRETATLRAETADVAALRQENQRLAQASTEVAQLRRDSSEVARLQTEIAAAKSAKSSPVARTATVPASGAGQKIWPASALDVPPAVIGGQGPPKYPVEMRTAGIGGEVVVEFTIGDDGRVRDVTAAKSSRPEFEAPAIEAVSRWKFSPGMKDGQAANARMQIPILFGVADEETKKARAAGKGDGAAKTEKTGNWF